MVGDRRVGSAGRARVRDEDRRPGRLRVAPSVALHPKVGLRLVPREVLEFAEACAVFPKHHTGLRRDPLVVQVFRNFPTHNPPVKRAVLRVGSVWLVLVTLSP